MSAVAPTLQEFFTDQLATQRYASPATIAAYRDAFRLLLVSSPTTRRSPRPIIWTWRIPVNVVTGRLYH